MPTDAETDPPAAAASPTKDEVKAWVAEALRETLAGGGKPADAPDLSSDKKIEEYVESKVREAMEEIVKAEQAAGQQVPDATPDPTPDPEGQPESKESWQERLGKFIWGPA